MKKSPILLLCLLASNLYSSNQQNNPTGNNKRTFSNFNEDNTLENNSIDENNKKRRLLRSLNNGQLPNSSSSTNQQYTVSPNLSLHEDPTIKLLLNHAAQQTSTAQKKSILGTILSQIEKIDELKQKTIQEIRKNLCLAIIKKDPTAILKILNPLAPDLRATLLNQSQPIELDNQKFGLSLYECSCNPLGYAVKNGMLFIAERLISYGAPLQQSKSLPIVHQLIEYSTQKNTSETIALLTKIFTKNPTLVYSRDLTRKTLLHRAVAKLNYPLITFLLDKNAPINAKDDKNQTTLHYLALASSPDEADPEKNKKIKEIFTTLEKKGPLVGINEENKDGLTPLHIASENSCATLIDAFLMKGANPNCKNKQGFTPLHLCSKSKAAGGKKSNYEMVQKLIDYGANVNQPIGTMSETTALQYSVKEDDELTVFALLTKGATVAFPKDRHFSGRFCRFITNIIEKYINDKAIEAKKKTTLTDLLKKNDSTGLSLINREENRNATGSYIFRTLANPTLIEGDELFGGKIIKQAEKDKLLEGIKTGTITTNALDSLVKKLVLCFFLPVPSIEDCRKFPEQQSTAKKKIYFTPEELKLFNEVFSPLVKDPRFKLLAKIPGAVNTCTLFKNKFKHPAIQCGYNNTGKKSGTVKKDISIKFKSPQRLPNK